MARCLFEATLRAVFFLGAALRVLTGASSSHHFRAGDFLALRAVAFLATALCFLAGASSSHHLERQLF